ncbi:hypothetical protein, partial [Ideonella livida]
PAPAPAAAVPAAPAPTPAVPARPRPAPVAAPAEPAPAVPASPTLQDQNNELSIKLRAANEVHARELLEKSQQFQAERLKFERQLEDMRQAHSDELGRLMALMVQQVDALQQEHSQKVRVLEAELERLRLEVGQGGTISTHRTQEVRGVGMTPGPVGRRGP